MNDTATTTGSTLTARFALRAEAEAAAARLREAGVAEGRIRLTEEAAGHSQSGMSVAGFVATIRQLFEPKPQRTNPSTSEARGRCVLRLGDLTGPEHQRAAEILRGAGAVAVEETPGADPADFVPRKVQPGFKDVAPGFVPEPSTAAGGAKPPDHPVNFDEPRGRFTDELKELPEETGAGAAEAEPRGASAPIPGGESAHAGGKPDIKAATSGVAPQGGGAPAGGEANAEAVPSGTPGAGENLCRRCAGTGKIEGAACPDCGGSGTVITPIGGG